MSEIKNKVLLNEKQAAEMLGFKVQTLRKWRWAGEPPRYMKVGVKIFYDQADLQEYLNDCICEPIKGKGKQDA